MVVVQKCGQPPFNSAIIMDHRFGISAGGALAGDNSRPLSSPVGADSILAAIGVLTEATNRLLESVGLARSIADTLVGPAQAATGPSDPPRAPSPGQVPMLHEIASVLHDELDRLNHQLHRTSNVVGG